MFTYEKNARILGEKSRRLPALLATGATISPNPAQGKVSPRHSLPWKPATSTPQVVNSVLGRVQKFIPCVIFKQVANTKGNEGEDTLLIPETILIKVRTFLYC